LDVILEMHDIFSREELLDFLFLTFKPKKIDISTGSELQVTLSKCLPFSPSWIIKEIRDFYQRKNIPISLRDINILSIEYTVKEQELLDNIIVYGKVLKP